VGNHITTNGSAEATTVVSFNDFILLSGPTVYT